MAGCTNVVNIDETIKSPNSKLCGFEVVETSFYGAILVDKNTNVLYTGFRVISWIVTCGVVKLITLCFGLTFKWSIATGIWLIICILKSIFNVTVKN